jgi:orotidine-5'-phosphate decarboxylase
MDKIQLTDFEKKAKDHLCLALDVYDEERIIEYVKELSDLIGYFKINFAFDKFGPKLVEKMLSYEVKVFLDLKIHDIPNTVAGYADNAVRLGVSIVTVHTAGGKDMMMEIVKTAKSTAKELGVNPPKFLGVTLLTNIDEKIMNSELNIQGRLSDEVARRAKLAADSGLDGIVCSPVELSSIKSGLPKDFFYLTPGVRSEGVINHDHKRVDTYANAIKSGSSLLVVGREILGANDRRKAVLQAIKEISNELQNV